MLLINTYFNSKNIEFVFLSWYVMFNIFLAVFVCAAASLFFAWLVSAHAPYAIVGSMHQL